MPEDNMICGACVLIDGENNVRPVRCTFCPRCNAWLCDRCMASVWRRLLAALLSKLKHRAWAVLPLLILLGLAATPARAQSACGAGLQPIPAFNVSDTLNKIWQGACWDPVGHIITLPLTAIGGGGTVTHTLGPLTSSGLILGNGGNDVKVVTGTSGGVPFWSSSTTISFSPTLANSGGGQAGVVLGGGAGGAPFTDTGFNFDRSVPSVSNLQLGVTGSATGQIEFFNTTSGFILLKAPVTGALGAPVLTLPDATGTLALASSATAGFVQLAPGADQTITGAHALILNNSGSSIIIGDPTGITQQVPGMVNLNYPATGTGATREVFNVTSAAGSAGGLAPILFFNDTTTFSNSQFYDFFRTNNGWPFQDAIFSFAGSPFQTGIQTSQTLFRMGTTQGTGIDTFAYDASLGRWAIGGGGASGFLDWNGATLTIGSTDTGISRDAAASFDFGNGTAGDRSATLNAATILERDGTGNPKIDLTFNAGTLLSSDLGIGWAANTTSIFPSDTFISRGAAGVVAIGTTNTPGDVTGTIKAGAYATGTNCASGASPAVCGSATAGAVAIPTGTNPTLQINTSGVTANSRILLEVDESSTIASTTCNTTLSSLVQPVVTARTPGTSFTIQIGAVIAANPVCLSYLVFN